MKNTEKEHLQFAVLAVDVVIFTVRDGKLLMRLSNVDRPPYFNNVPGFPGGLISPEETAKEAAIRIVEEKAGINPKHVYLKQLHTFSRVDRDPRGRVVSVGYIALVSWEKLTQEEQTDSKKIWWSEKKSYKNFAYDHGFVLEKAFHHLQHIVKSTTASFRLLPHHFTLTMLENMLETILGEHIDKRNFRKKIEKLDILKELNEKTVGMKHRPAQLYAPKSHEVLEIGLL